MNNFGVGYAEDLKNGCNSHGEAIILNPSRWDTNYSLFNIHYSFKFQIAQQSDKQEFDFLCNEGAQSRGGALLWVPVFMTDQAICTEWLRLAPWWRSLGVSDRKCPRYEHR